MIVTTWVHRVDTLKFPSVPEGWRWCVGGGTDPSDVRFWLNAGWAPTQVEAEFVGQQAAATAINALVLAGVADVEGRSEVLEDDPCQPEDLNVPMPGSITVDSVPVQVGVSDQGVPTPLTDGPIDPPA